MCLFSLNKVPFNEKPYTRLICLKKIKCINISLLFMFLILFSNAQALSFKVKAIANKIVDTKSNAFSSFKVIRLRRGTTDLIFEGDHYRFSKDKKFLFRGVCFEVNEFESTWLLYNHFSKGTSYQEILNGEKIKKYLLPRRIRNLLSIVKPNMGFYEEQFEGKIKSKKKVDQTDDRGVIKVVDGKDVDLNPSVFTKKKEHKKIINQLERFKFTFDLGPIMINTNPNTVNSALGFSFSCLYCTDFTYFLKYNFFHQTQEPRRIDFGKDIDLISSNFHEVTGHMEWRRVFENISFYSRAYANRVKTSDTLNGQDIYSPEYLIRITPFALRFHVLNKLENVDASIGIGPSYSIEKFQFNDGGVLAIDQGNKLRWSFNFYAKWVVTKGFTLSSDSWFHPLNSGEGGSFDVYDSGPSRFNLMANYKLSDNLSLSFLSELFWNGLQKRREDLPSSNFVNSLKFHYSVEF